MALAVTSDSVRDAMESFIAVEEYAFPLLKEYADGKSYLPVEGSKEDDYSEWP